MRFLAALLLLVLSVQPVYAKHPAKHAVTQTVSESDLQEHGTYTNSDGEQVHRPAHAKNGKVPHGASAKCADGTFSFSRHHRGTCSRHGGVVEWLD